MSQKVHVEFFVEKGVKRSAKTGKVLSGKSPLHTYGKVKKPDKFKNTTIKLSDRQEQIHKATVDGVKGMRSGGIKQRQTYGTGYANMKTAIMASRLQALYPDEFNAVVSLANQLGSHYSKYDPKGRKFKLYNVKSIKLGEYKVKGDLGSDNHNAKLVKHKKEPASCKATPKKHTPKKHPNTQPKTHAKQVVLNILPG